jgi:hypothetical protein
MGCILFNESLAFSRFTTTSGVKEAKCIVEKI